MNKINPHQGRGFNRFRSGHQSKPNSQMLVNIETIRSDQATFQSPERRSGPVREARGPSRGPGRGSGRSPRDEKPSEPPSTRG